MLSSEDRNIAGGEDSKTGVVFSGSRSRDALVVLVSKSVVLFDAIDSLPASARPDSSKPRKDSSKSSVTARRSFEAARKKVVAQYIMKNVNSTQISNLNLIYKNNESQIAKIKEQCHTLH